MVNLEDTMLREKDGMDGKVTDIESDKEQKGKDDDVRYQVPSFKGQTKHKLNKSRSHHFTFLSFLHFHFLFFSFPFTSWLTHLLTHHTPQQSAYLSGT